MKILLDAVVQNEDLAKAAKQALDRHNFGPAMKVQAVSEDSLWVVRVSCDLVSDQMKRRVHDFWYGFCAGWDAGKAARIS